MFYTFLKLNSADLIDGPEICGFEIYSSTVARRYSFFVTFRRGSLIARFFLFMREKFTELFRTIEDSIRLAGVPVPENPDLFDHAHR